MWYVRNDPRRGEVMVRLVWLSTLVLLLGHAAAAAGDAKETTTGRIVSFECGDNCYLTIKQANGAEMTALCAARACRPWNDAALMPTRLIGARVLVTIAAGRQYDGSGADMGEFPAFSRVDFVK